MLLVYMRYFEPLSLLCYFELRPIPTIISVNNHITMPAWSPPPDYVSIHLSNSFHLSTRPPICAIKSETVETVINWRSRRPHMESRGRPKLVDGCEDTTLISQELQWANNNNDHCLGQMQMHQFAHLSPLAVWSHPIENSHHDLHRFRYGYIPRLGALLIRQSVAETRIWFFLLHLRSKVRPHIQISSSQMHCNCIRNTVLRI